jgi:aminoglycoside 6'-N-acetyltransferase I
MTNFRYFNPKYLSECSKLYVRTFNGEPWNDKWTAFSASQRLKDITNTPRFYGLLYLEKNKIIGAIFGNIECWYHKYHYNLKEMFIDPEYQHMGIGSKMIKKINIDLKKRHVIGMYLFTSSDKWTSNFYKKNNFKSLNNMQMMNKNIK